MYSIYFELSLKPFLLLVSLFLSNGCHTSVDSTLESINGNLNRHTLSNGMIVDVLLPQNYNKFDLYPVLLLNDGELIFNPNGWDMGTLLNRMIEDQEINPIIAVAIHSQGMRNNWYVPYNDSWMRDNWGPYTPQAREYANAIFNDILPLLKETYSINLEEVGIMGASLGGLISTWMGLKYPDKIKYSAGLSGALWVDDYQIFNEVLEFYDNKNKFWFDIGTGEWNYYVPLYRALEKAGLIPGINNFYYEIPNGRHTISDWKLRLFMPLKVFFGPEQSPVLEKMDVVLECIPSQSTINTFFRRMNPIITRTDHVKFSLAHAASYELISGDTELGTEGSFINNPNIESKVNVNFMNFSESITIPENFCP